MNFLNGIAILLFYQLAGTIFVLWLDIKTPGPVLGMILLFATLLLMRRIPESLSFSADHLLKHLSLLFVPAGVGVVTHLQRIGSEWFPIVTTLFVSTLVSMAVTAWVMQWMVRMLRKSSSHE
jgi:holin-like protein